VRFRVNASVLAACAAICLAGPGCTPLPVEEEPAEPIVFGDLFVHLPDLEVRRGENLRVHLTIDHHGGRPFTLYFADSCQLTWIIRDTEGHVVTPNHFCWQRPTMIKLDRQGRHSLGLAIPTTRDAALGWPFAEDSLPPGYYMLEVYVRGYEDRYRTEFPWFEVLE